MAGAADRRAASLDSHESVPSCRPRWTAARHGLGVLENAGLITLEKGYAGKRARTWIAITKAGQAALADEIAQLKLLISRIDSVGTSPA
jgi:hypothetical protein